MVFLFFSFLFFLPPFYIEIFETGKGVSFRSFRFRYHRGGFSTILRYFIYTAITKSRTFRWLVWPRSRSHSASLSSNASEKPEGGSSLGTNRFPDPSRSWSRLEQELLDWCLGLPNPEIGPKLERVSSLVWRASCNILREATTDNSSSRLIYFKLFKHHKIIPYLDLPLPGNDFLSKIGEGSVDVLDSGPWYRKSESKRETQRFFQVKIDDERVFLRYDPHHHFFPRFRSNEDNKQAWNTRSHIWCTLNKQYI